MEELFERLEKLCKLNLQKIDSEEALLATIEEVGELAKAIRVEDKDCKKKITESAMVESVDVILCVFEVFVSRGGTLPLFVKIAHTKLNKFEKNLHEND